MLDLVEKIVLHAYQVTREDVDVLRRHGFDDGEIVDVVVAAAARCFISKMLDALGAEVDAEYRGDAALARLTAFER